MQVLQVDIVIPCVEDGEQLKGFITRHKPVMVDNFFRPIFLVKSVQTEDSDFVAPIGEIFYNCGTIGEALCWYLSRPHNNWALMLGLDDSISMSYAAYLRDLILREDGVSRKIVASSFTIHEYLGRVSVPNRFDRIKLSRSRFFTFVHPGLLYSPAVLSEFRDFDLLNLKEMPNFVYDLWILNALSVIKVDKHYIFSEDGVRFGYSENSLSVTHLGNPEYSKYLKKFNNYNWATEFFCFFVFKMGAQWSRLKSFIKRFQFF